MLTVQKYELNFNYQNVDVSSVKHKRSEGTLLKDVCRFWNTILLASSFFFQNIHL